MKHKEVWIAFVAAILGAIIAVVGPPHYKRYIQDQ
jgi:hypothetical protein